MTDPFRPASWDEFIGQDALKRELAIRINAAKEENRRLGHVLLSTLAGSGKTSLAYVIASELDEDLVCVTAPVTPKALTNIALQHEGVLLIDECHSLGKRGMEFLMPLLLEGRFDLPSGKTVDAPWLTVIGATTEPQQLLKPFMQRFECSPAFDPYTDEEMAKIISQMVRKLDLTMSPETTSELGTAALGVPRHARGFVLAYRDLLVGANTPPTAAEVLRFCRVAEDGLTVHHERLLETLSALGGTAGLRVLSNLLRLNPAVVEELELSLIKHGLLEYSERGRSLTREGFARARKGSAA